MKITLFFIIIVFTATMYCLSTELREGFNFQSSHQCIGWDFTKDSWKRRSCYLKNVCYLHDGLENNLTSRWIYIDDGVTNSNDLAVSLSPLIHKGIDKRLGKKASFHIYKDNFNLSSLPQRNGLHILYESYNAANFGHFIGDELLPLYHAAHNFGFAEKLNDIQILRWIDRTSDTTSPLRYSCESEGIYRDDEKIMERCKGFYDKLSPLLSLKRIETLNDFSESFCVSKMIVGIGMFSDHCEDPTEHGRKSQLNPANCNYGISTLLWQFKNHMMKNNDFLVENNTKSFNKVRNYMGKSTEILVNIQNGNNQKKRTPDNYIKSIKTVAKDLNKTVSFVIMSALSIQEQIYLISNARLFISAVGGSSFISIFLPKGSSVILVTDDYRDKQLDFGFYAGFSYIHVSYIMTSKSKRNLDETDLKLRILNRFKSDNIWS
jgi:hypothetical protein